MTDEKKAPWRRRLQDLLIGTGLLFWLVLLVTVREWIFHGVWNLFTDCVFAIFLAIVAVGIALNLRSWWCRPTYRRPGASMINVDLHSNGKTIALVAAALAAIALLVLRQRYYWPHFWPHGPTASWSVWDWAYVSVSVAFIPFAIVLRFQRWSSRIDLWENTRMRREASKLKFGDRDDGGSVK